MDVAWLVVTCTVVFVCGYFVGDGSGYDRGWKHALEVSARWWRS